MKSGKLQHCKEKSVNSYKNIYSELTVSETGLLLRNRRIVLPKSLQEKAIIIAHEGHLGMTKTKSLLRSKVWYPTMDRMVENIISACHECAINTSNTHPEPLQMSALPKGHWMNISLDFCGPLPSGDFLVVIVDEYSRFPVVETTRSLAAEKIIPIIDKNFAMFAYPIVMKTDNGTPFQSKLWSDFCIHHNVKHRKITPIWPQANAQAESFNKPMMKSIRIANTTNKSWKQELQTFLRMYRCSTHPYTGLSPYELMFGRAARTKLPQLEDTDKNYDIGNQHDTNKKETMKVYADKKRNAKISEIKIGNRVYMKQTKINKLSSPFSSKPYTVITKKGNMLTVCDDEKRYVTRNVSFFKKVNMYNCRVGDPIPVTPMHEIPEVSEPILPRRSERTKHPSILLRGYVCE